MNPLETYLRRATRGVWGKKKLEVIAELRGSIEARAWKLECLGFGAERALEMAMHEMGEANAIAAGLTKVHTMPTILKSTLALGLFASIAITSLNSSQAQIEVTTETWARYGQLENVRLNVDSAPKYATFFLKFSSIKQNLEAVGILVDDTPQGLLECCPNQQKVVPTLRFDLPGGRKRVVVQAVPFVWKKPGGGLEWDKFPPASVRSDEYFIPFWSFVRQLKQTSDLPVQVEGCCNPKLRIGSTVLQVGTERFPATPWNLYLSFASRYVWDHFDSKSQIALGSVGGGLFQHAIRVNSPAGTVYATAEPDRYAKGIYWDIVRVAKDGILYFTATHQVLEFTKSARELEKDLVNPRPSGYGFSKNPAKALLVRVTNDFNTTFELPARVRSGALK